MRGARFNFWPGLIAGFVAVAALGAPTVGAQPNPQPPAPVLQGQAGERVTLKNDNPGRNFSWTISPIEAAVRDRTSFCHPRTVKIGQSRGSAVSELEIEYAADAHRAIAGATVTLTKTRDGFVAKTRLGNRDYQLAMPASAANHPADAVRASEEAAQRAMLDRNGPMMMDDNRADAEQANSLMVAAMVENVGLFAFNPFRQMLGRSQNFRVGDSVAVDVADVPTEQILGAQSANVQANSQRMLIEMDTHECRKAELTVAGTTTDNGKTFVVFRARFEFITRRNDIRNGQIEAAGHTNWVWEGFMFFEQDSGWFTKMDGTMSAEHFDAANANVNSMAATPAKLAWAKR